MRSLLCLGVDGGGTKTVAWLGRVKHQQLTVLGRGVGGPGNPRAIGFAAALQHVAQAVEQAFDDAQLPTQAVDTACLCLAGVGRAAEQQRVQQWLLSERLAARGRIIGDAECILAAAEVQEPGLTEVNGIALIAGTGSMAWGRDAAGKATRCGGWGYLLGDEGSGYALSLNALKLACRAADRRSPNTRLLAAMLEATGCTTAEQLVEWTYGEHASRERIAALAVDIFPLADRFPEISRLVADGAAQLAEMVATVAAQAGMHDFYVAMAGGVVCHQPAYLEQIHQQLAATRYSPRRVLLVREPVCGALQLASQVTADRSEA